MADSNEFQQLIQLLTVRLDRQEAREEARDEAAEARHQTAEVRYQAAEARHATAEARHVTAEARHEAAEARHEAAEARHVATEARLDRQDTRLDRQEHKQDTTNDILLRMLTQQEALFNLHQNFQKSQEKFNERQDQFNIIFLDEIRDIKHDVRDVKKEINTLLTLTIKQHDERLKKLEDFMDGFMRKAG